MSFSQFSVDPFLEEVTLVVIFPDSGEVAIVSNFDSKGRIYQGGEPIPQLRNKDGTEDTAVLLGWGETEADAITTAREYIKRVAKWHGHEEGEVELNLFGHDLAQSEMFKDLTQCNSGFLEKCMQKLQEDQEQGDISSSPSTPSDSTRTDTSLDKLSVQKLIESAVAQAIAVNNQHQHSPSASGVLRSTSAEVVDLGYNTLVSSHLHTMAMATDSPTRMTTILLEAAYPSDSHLIGKTYAGQKKTFNGKVYQKPGIKKRKRIVAIKETVFRKHPKFTCSSFGQTINNYIAKLALPSRRPPNEQELEDDTDEKGP